MSSQTVLYVEDEPDDVFFMRLAFTEAGLNHRLESVGDGQAAIHYLEGSGSFADRERFPLPALVLLDLNLPLRSGMEVLKWIRGHAQLRTLPVVVLTSSNQPADEEKARRMGANDYLTKPSNPLDLQRMVQTALKRWTA